MTSQAPLKRLIFSPGFLSYCINGISSLLELYNFQTDGSECDVVGKQKLFRNCYEAHSIYVQSANVKTQLFVSELLFQVTKVFHFSVSRSMTCILDVRERVETIDSVRFL